MSEILSLQGHGLDFFDNSSYIEIEPVCFSNNQFYQYEHKQTKNKILIREINPDNQQNEDQILEMLQKVQLIKSKPHKNIIEVKGFHKVMSQNMFQNQMVYRIAYESCVYDLNQFILDRFQKSQDFSQTQIQSFIEQIVSGLAHLQQKLRISLQNINPENILVSRFHTFKIANFDQSTIKLSSLKTTKLKKTNIAYASPEIIKFHLKSNQYIDFNVYRSDVYSVGLVLLYHCTFYQFSDTQRLKNEADGLSINEKIEQLRKQVKQKYGKSMSKLLKLMLINDNLMRADFIQLQEKMIEIGFFKTRPFFRSSTNSDPDKIQNKKMEKIEKSIIKSQNGNSNSYKKYLYDEGIKTVSDPDMSDESSQIFKESLKTVQVSALFDKNKMQAQSMDQFSIQPYDQQISNSPKNPKNFQIKQTQNNLQQMININPLESSDFSQSLLISKDNSELIKLQKKTQKQNRLLIWIIIVLLVLFLIAFSIYLWKEL